MPYEVPLLVKLGFEVFTPKIASNKVRSNSISYDFDSSLTIPREVLEILNRFDFYESEWPAQITSMLNEHFGLAFSIPVGRQFEEVVGKFYGQIVLRLFGSLNENTYKKTLEIMYGPQLLLMLNEISSRFWFGEAFDCLHECEPEFFKSRSLYLPIGLPDEYFKNKNKWRGGNGKILFLCPDIITDDYSANEYGKFKRFFGDLPHVIVGTQQVPVEDPCVVGFVSDEELEHLYLECEVMYYHSIERRHVHYSPIEAAICGMPLVYFKESLLGRLSDSDCEGGVNTVEEARTLIGEILAGNKALSDRLRTVQSSLGFHFSDEYCRPVWERNFQQSGLLAELRKSNGLRGIWIDFKKKLLGRLAQGGDGDCIPRNWAAVRPVRDVVQAIKRGDRTIEDGIDFSNSEFPPYLIYLTGLHGLGLNDKGRWSSGSKVVLGIDTWLRGEFRLRLTVSGYGPNLGHELLVTIGDKEKTVRLGNTPGEIQEFCLDFHLSQPANFIEIQVPYTAQLPNDPRLAGFALFSICTEHVLGIAQLKSLGHKTLEDGIDFSAASYPHFLSGVSGLSAAESWGRWSDGEEVVLDLRHWLSGRFRLHLRIQVYGRNAGEPIPIRIGSNVRTLLLDSGGDAQDRAVDFDLAKPQSVIKISVPYPTQPPNDSRTIGVGLVSMRLSLL